MQSYGLMFFKSFRDSLNFHGGLEITWMACFLMMYGRHAGLRFVVFLMFLTKAEGQGSKDAVPLQTMEGSVEQHGQLVKRDQPIHAGILVLTLINPKHIYFRTVMDEVHGVLTGNMHQIAG